MALSGTLDTFAIPDVLRLLSSTSKTGRLHITGDRGSGSVWVADGDIVATELASAVSQDPTDIEVVYGLLRFSAGSFTFEADSMATNATASSPMESILGGAENMLAEWRSIEDVIPSLDVWVGLTPEIQGPDVMVDTIRWRAIAAIGSGAQVGAVAEALSLSEIDGCRLAKELVELGFVDLIDEPATAVASTSTSFEPEAENFDDGIADAATDDYAQSPDGPTDDHSEPGDDEPAPSETGVVPSLASLEPRGGGSIDPLLPAGDPLDEMGRLEADRETADVFAGTGGATAPDTDDDDLDSAEMARQLANLSPKAAKAVAAAAKATTAAERDAALAAVEAEDDSVNRGLLLKFLGSVDS